MSEQRDDCDRFCMAPHGNHHPRCPAMTDEIQVWWQKIGKEANETATAEQLVRFVREAPTPIALAMCEHLIDITRQANNCVVQSHDGLIKHLRFVIASRSEDEPARGGEIPSAPQGSVPVRVVNVREGMTHVRTLDGQDAIVPAPNNGRDNR